MDPLSPAQRAILDQGLEGFLQLLTNFGVDRDDPEAMAAVLATIKALTALSSVPGVDMATMMRGILLALTERS